MQLGQRDLRFSVSFKLSIITRTLIDPLRQAVIFTKDGQVMQGGNALHTALVGSLLFGTLLSIAFQPHLLFFAFPVFALAPPLVAFGAFPLLSLALLRPPLLPILLQLVLQSAASS